jgi:hypothetical protein
MLRRLPPGKKVRGCSFMPIDIVHSPRLRFRQKVLPLQNVPPLGISFHWRGWFLLGLAIYCVAWKKRTLVRNIIIL